MGKKPTCGGKEAGSGVTRVHRRVFLSATSVLTGSSQKHILYARAATVKGIKKIIFEYFIREKCLIGKILSETLV